MLYSELSQYTHKQLSQFTHAQLALMSHGGLIIDRTLADVGRWMELRDKGWADMSESERQEWMGEIDVTPSAAKGMYTHVDLNRVEGAVESIVNRFKDAGYSVPEMTIVTDRTYKTKFRDTDAQRYFRNISTVRGLVPVYHTTPRVPYIGEPFDHARANDIEKILVDVDEVFTKLTQSWQYAGDLFTGEV